MFCVYLDVFVFVLVVVVVYMRKSIAQVLSARNNLDRRRKLMKKCKENLRNTICE